MTELACIFLVAIMKYIKFEKRALELTKNGDGDFHLHRVIVVLSTSFSFFLFLLLFFYLIQHVLHLRGERGI